MGGRTAKGTQRRAGSVRTLARRLEAAVGREYAKTMLEVAEALAIFEVQLERGEYRQVRTELLQLHRALEAAARDVGM